MTAKNVGRLDPSRRKNAVKANACGGMRSSRLTLETVKSTVTTINIVGATFRRPKNKRVDVGIDPYAIKFSLAVTLFPLLT